MKRTYRNLDAWTLACDLAVAVYSHTTHFPESERYGLTSQMRRASVSVAANIAEGWGRSLNRDFARFLRIAAGSLAELETYFELARRLGLLQAEEVAVLTNHATDAGRTLYGLLRSLNEPEPEE